jgi:hypothetical protein
MALTGPLTRPPAARLKANMNNGASPLAAAPVTSPLPKAAAAPVAAAEASEPAAAPAPVAAAAAPVQVQVRTGRLDVLLQQL